MSDDPSGSEPRYPLSIHEQQRMASQALKTYMAARASSERLVKDLESHLKKPVAATGWDMYRTKVGQIAHEHEQNTTQMRQQFDLIETQYPAGYGSILMHNGVAPEDLDAYSAGIWGVDLERKKMNKAEADFIALQASIQSRHDRSHPELKNEAKHKSKNKSKKRSKQQSNPRPDSQSISRSNTHSRRASKGPRGPKCVIL